MMTPMRKRLPAAPAADPLAQLVQGRLAALGDFSHLRVVRRGDHIFIERVGAVRIVGPWLDPFFPGTSGTVY